MAEKKTTYERIYSLLEKDYPDFERRILKDEDF